MVASIGSLEYQTCSHRSWFAAVDGGFGAPYGGEAADGLVDFLVEAKEVADDAAVQEGAVGVGEIDVTLLG